MNRSRSRGPVNCWPGYWLAVEVVAADHADHAGFAVGDRIGIPWLRHPCGTCEFYRRGAENLCPSSQYTGWDTDGGYAEYVTAPADFALSLPAYPLDRADRALSDLLHGRFDGAAVLVP